MTIEDWACRSPAGSLTPGNKPGIIGYGICVSSSYRDGGTIENQSQGDLVAYLDLILLYSSRMIDGSRPAPLSPPSDHIDYS
jgi:hypothetical protein